ncbi:BMP family ABC transporter substrate-binding protein [Treponema sp.]|uniref:BMP family lipoprotein n=1 Tax=Treponema sp. TaxID=166 RepID=UPI0025F533A3|nr:BMP family ABC transporter substrate-binding protein [Treponema sp.]MCR5219316.1 BMP family ABC transporter substrate-binding protein [Treponema sp.]
MKRLIAAALVAITAFAGLASCSSKDSADICMVTDSGDITDQSFNQTTYEACKEFAKDNKLNFKYFKPTANTTAARVASIDLAAKEKKVKAIVLPGFLFAEAIVERAEKYPHIKFIALDVSEFDVMSAAEAKQKKGYILPKNVFCAVYDEQIPGYMAGYAAVKEGFEHLGFLGGMAVPAVIRYGYGYVQGANQAAVEMKKTDKVTIEYVYGGQFYGDAQIKGVMDSWYTGRGVEVVFACGGGIFTSACEAAKDVGGKVIGVDTDQSALINSTYVDGMCVTSAMKGLAATVKSNLAAIVDGTWDDVYGGQINSLGLVSSTNLDLNYVQLPTDTWSMKNFSVDEYKALVAKLCTGELKVSADTDKAPAVAVKFNTYANIK